MIESPGVGVLSLVEMNVKWGKSSLENKVHHMFHKVWKNFSMNHSHIDESFSKDNQPGGTMRVVLNDWTSRIQEKGTDPFGLGRWSYQVLRGKGGIKVTIITAYRVSQEYMSSLGPKTTAMQEFRSLSKQYRTVEIQFDPKPRFQFIIDLQAWVEELIRQSYEIILFMDTNEGVDEQPGKYCPLELNLDKPILGRGHDGLLATLIRTCGLCDPLRAHLPNEKPPPTYNRGNQRINVILTTPKVMKALTSYVQYLLPKLRYQPPLLCLTRHECDKVLSPVLMALLPKLHLNRHTSRAIVHGPEEYGGLALPHLYTLQGVDKLKLFLGHLRLQDRTGHLIHIDMTHVQLLTGTSTLFLNQDSAKYEWIESGWLMSLRAFISRTKVSITYPLSWQPIIQHDRILMDYFVRMGLPNKTLEIINRCCLYLQVITVSDVVATNGQIILASAKAGHRLNTRISMLS
jgi:hypothetical protein